MYQLESLQNKVLPDFSVQRYKLQPKPGISYSYKNYKQKEFAESNVGMSDGEIIRMKPFEKEEELMHPVFEDEGIFQTTFRQSVAQNNNLILSPTENTINASKFHPISEVSGFINQSDNYIQRVPMPEESTVTTMSDYEAGSRQGIKFDTGFDWQSVLSRYFVRGIVMDVRSGYNVTYVVRGFPAGEEWVSNALKALMLYNFNLSSSSTESPVVNRTTVQHLDLNSFTNPADTAINGPNANFRFTSTQFDATGPRTARIQNVQLLVEKLSNFTATTSTETAAQRRQRFATTYQITNAVPVRNDPLGDPLEAMSDSQFDQVLEGLNRVPAALLSTVTGIPIHRSPDARGPHNEVAEYKQTRAAGSTTWERRIVVYNDYFGMNADQKAFTMIHEIGHALDFRPNEASGGSGGPSASAATGRGSFRAAVRLDGGLGKGVSTYAATTTDYDEYYAEAFALYQSQPSTLSALRPHVYEYFRTQYP